MIIIHRINHALAQIVALMNVATAVLVVLLAAAVGFQQAGLFGLIGGALIGTAAAAVVCGLLALLINIRDLLAESVTQHG